MYPTLLHKMAPFCMNTTKKSPGGRHLDPPSNTTLLNPIIHINTKKNQYQNISATKYIIIRASSLQNVMQNIKPCPLPLLNPRTNPLPHFILFYFIIFIYFCLFKNLLRVKINILSSVYPEINFTAESVMKINNLS